MTPDLRRVSCLGELLSDALLTYKSNVALIEADRHRERRRLTYLQTLTEAETLAAVLQETLAEGERCAILMSNQSRWVTGAMAACFCGAVLVPLDYKLTVKEQLSLLAFASPRVLVTEYPVYRDLKRLDDNKVLATVRVIVTEVPEKEQLGSGAEHFPEADPAVARRCIHRQRQRSDLASIVFSSGTSGRPKGCMLTHDNYLEQAQVLARMFPMEEGDSYLSVLPTNHAIDFMCGVVIPYLFGASVVHQRTLRAEFLAPTMKRYRVTHTAMVPRILKALRDKIEEQLSDVSEWQHTVLRGLVEVNELATMKAPNQRLSRALLYPIQERFGGRLRLIFAGGAFVDPTLANYFYRMGLPVVIGYGLTEACTVLTVNDLAPFRGNTVGRPVEGVDVELRNKSTDGIGEVYARGRTIMSGYLDDPEQTVEAIQDGWLRTGDLGRLDASGHLQLVGRAKNMIVTEGGKNVYPEDVEATFDGLSCEELCVLAESFVWPISTGLVSGRLTMVLRPQEGKSLDAAIANMQERNRSLKDYKRLGSYVVLDAEFPRTASMKVKRDQLAQMIRERGLEPQFLHAPVVATAAS